MGRGFRRASAAVIVGAVIVSLSCSNPSGPEGDLGSRVGVSADIDMLGFSATSGFSAEAYWVVEDQEELATVWQGVWLGNPDPPSTPAVDFTASVVVVAALGVDPELLYLYARIDSLVVHQRGTVAWITRIRPGPACRGTGGVMAPVTVARVPRAAQFQFRQTDEFLPCPPGGAE